MKGAMAYVRRTYGVPAKRGMRVTPKVGKFMAGKPGRILRATESGTLIVRDDGNTRRLAWWAHFHPSDLNYGGGA